VAISAPSGWLPQAAVAVAPWRGARPFDGRPVASRRRHGHVGRDGDGWCGGLFSRATGFINARELDWARELTQRGYVVLMVDSRQRQGVPDGRLSMYT